ncbi:MAG: hypothetical protein FWG51_02500 [Firmicutes bacterium]|nr:hypothetical protein [Bacillota bacterium]
MSSAAAVIAVQEEYFKKYMICCEYLQIDPSLIHEITFIEQRIADFFEVWNDESIDEKTLKKLNKTFKWFLKYYQKLANSGFFNYGFARRCEKLIAKGQIQITHEEIFAKKELRHDNYDLYAKRQNKIAFIALGIIGGLLIMGAVIAIILS